MGSAALSGIRLVKAASGQQQQQAEGMLAGVPTLADALESHRKYMEELPGRRIGGMLKGTIRALSRQPGGLLGSLTVNTNK